MIRLCYANRTEALLEALARDMDARREERDPLEPAHVIVPNRNMERYVELGLARTLGVAANLSFHRLERFVREQLEVLVPGVHVLDRRTLEMRVLGILLDDDALADEPLAPVRRFLEAGGDDPDAADLRRVQLATRLAGLFEEYAFSRPEMMDAWRADHAAAPRAGLEGTERWQRALWRRAMGRDDAEPRQAHEDSAASPYLLHEALQLASGTRAEEPVPVPGAVYVFGVSYVARVFQQAFAVLGQWIDVWLYTLNPCMEFWEDVPSAAELRAAQTRVARRADRLPVSAVAEHEEHPHLESAAHAPPLVLWGRPGREHVHLLNDVTGCDFEPRFRDPLAYGPHTVLAQLQHDVLALHPERNASDRPPDLGADGSIRVLASPGVRRETEAVAEAIWELVHEHDVGARERGERPLRFNDIAVLIAGADRDTYVPHLESVFAEAHRIPYNLVDVPLGSGSRIAEAAAALVDLPLSRFSRPEVLDVVTHPAVRRRAGDIDPHEWIALCDRLGVFHGLDHEEHKGTYIDRDVINWDQAARRLALGAVMTGERSGDERTVAIGGERYLPEETDVDGAAELALLVRSLASDVRFARRERRALGEWASFLAEMLKAYVVPADQTEESDLRRCLAAVHALAERDPGEPVGYRIAAELARDALNALEGGRGRYLAEGVTVSTLVPMRTIPFRVVFLLGLGEGRFPSVEPRDTMDLRSAHRRIGDVTPTERDEYTFLEAILSARERLVLSYVARDQLTGEAIEPSSVVRGLLDVLEGGYVPDRRDLVEHVPLSRDGAPDAEPPHTALPEAREEARARALGAQRRRAQERDTSGRADRARAVGDLRCQTDPDTWEHVRELLKLCPVPRPPEPVESPAQDAEDPSEPSDTIRVELSTLRRFLESPLQGWAGAVLGIEEEDEIDTREDEPFRVSALDETVTLRRVFVDALREGHDMDETYRAAVERLAAHGRWPVGAVAEARRVHDRSTIATWWTLYDEHVVRDAPPPERVRFGPGLEHGDADRLADTIVLDMPDPRPHRPGHPLRVEVVGQTQPVACSPRGSLVLAVRTPGDQKRLEAGRRALRAFLDQVALAAAGEPGPHHAFLFFGDGGPSGHEAAVPLVALSTEGARQWLTAVVTDLLGDTHAYYMPCYPVLAAQRDGWDDVSGLDLVARIEGQRDRRGSDGGGIGPVPDANRYPAPEPERALAMARRRFDLFDRLQRGRPV